MTINYGARIQYPDAADVERITNEVICSARAVFPNATPTICGAIAGEIRRRLCAEISVAVDLVVCASPTPDNGTPALPECVGANRGTQLRGYSWQGGL